MFLRLSTPELRRCYLNQARGALCFDALRVTGGTFFGNGIMRISGILAVAAVLVAVGAVATDAEAARKRRIVRHAAPVRASSVANAIANAPHAARLERGYICYVDHFHYGSSGSKPSRASAESAAANAWASFVDFEYGSAWASYARSGSKKMSCTQGAGGWDCSVEARPCK